MIERNQITWKWVVGLLSTLLLMAGGGWVAAINGQLQQTKQAQVEDRKAVSEVDKKVSVIEEHTRGIEKQIEEVKDAQKEQNRKLDELLLRSAR